MGDVVVEGSWGGREEGWRRLLHQGAVGWQPAGGGEKVQEHGGQQVRRGGTHKYIEEKCSYIIYSMKKTTLITLV